MTKHLICSFSCSILVTISCETSLEFLSVIAVQKVLHNNVLLAGNNLAIYWTCHITCMITNMSIKPFCNVLHLHPHDVCRYISFDIPLGSPLPYL